jgi:hypothetical protein
MVYAHLRSRNWMQRYREALAPPLELRPHDATRHWFDSLIGRISRRVDQGGSVCAASRRSAAPMLSSSSVCAGRIYVDLVEDQQAFPRREIKRLSNANLM